MKDNYRGANSLASLAHVCVAIAGLFLGNFASADANQSFVLQTAAKDDVAAAVRGLGGDVLVKYENIDAIAVTVPADKHLELFSLDGVEAVYKDQLVNAPAPAELYNVDSAEIQRTLAGAALEDAMANAPDGFVHHLIATGADELIFGEGLTGAGVLVAIIDSGTANVPSLAGRVIGGENFVPGASEPSATSFLNAPHGTWVGSTMAGNIVWCIGNGSPVVQSLLTHAPESVIVDLCDSGVSGVPMIGTAPRAEMYALKTFPASGGGAPESRIIAAMDRAITMRRNFNDGMPFTPVAGAGTDEDPFVYDSAPIQIVNMSLGGPTLFAGRDLEDQLTNAFYDVGITLIASAGNEGFAGMTGGSPGTGMGSVTSGAASLVANERVLRDLQFGLGIGSLYRPSDHTQMATFSSRGPTADGRIDPDNVSSGFAVFAEGALPGSLSVVSGTSFSAPSTAGGAALLREADPSASAAAIRDALIHTANPFVIPGAGIFDQGHGFVDFPAALAYLPDAGSSSDDGDSDSDDGPSSEVRNNVRHVGIDTIRLNGGSTSATVTDLVPGEVVQFYVEASDQTDALTIDFMNITPALPPSQQNQFFGDDIFVEVQDAMTSNDAVVGGGFFSSDTTVVVENPQTGLVRVAVMGDWTNAGTISADVKITETRNRQGQNTASGDVAQGETDVLTVDVPAGSVEAVFELAWKEHWGRYPTNDLDMILLGPLGSVVFDGATLHSPERVVLNAPNGGIWTVIVAGFTVHDGLDDDDDSDDVAASEWVLRVTADGNRLRASSGYDDDSD